MKIAAAQVRRKPRQSRAKVTQEALIETFVQLLAQQSAETITIRAITEVAGVGLGTFYEYFAKKQDLIALTIHQHVKQNAITLKTYAQSRIELSTNEELFLYLSHLIHFQITNIQQQSRIWSQLFCLERQISTPEAYQNHYKLMLDLWNGLLTPFMANLNIRQRFALNLHRIIYGFISQTLLLHPDFNAWDTLEQDILSSIQGLIAELECSISTL